MAAGRQLVVASWLGLSYPIAERSWIFLWNDLATIFNPGCDLFKRFSLEISYRHLVQIALQRDFAQQLLQRTCQGDLPHDLLQRSSQREFAGPGVSSARDHLE